jgi:hypothetical protein
MDPALGAAAQPQQAPPAITPIAPSVTKVYPVFSFSTIDAVALEPKSDTLWVKHGRRSDPPVRVDRATGKITKINLAIPPGRENVIVSSPEAPGRPEGDEDARYGAIVPGINGDVGIWDTGRGFWFWVDSAGTLVSVWSARPNVKDPTSKAFSDLKGNVYLEQKPRPILPVPYAPPIVVRLDSGKGLVDAAPIPITDDGRGVWNAYRLEPMGAGGGWVRPVLYAPKVLWGVDARGRSYAAWNDSHVVIVSDGSPQRRLALPNYREPLTAEEKALATQTLDTFEAAALKQGMTLSGPRPGVPEFRPQIDALVSEMNGGIAIVRSRRCESMPEWRAPGTKAPATDSAARCTFVERFDADGNRLQPFTLGSDETLMVLRGNTAWVSRSEKAGHRIVEMEVGR